ncbi:hypothetical protein J7J62_07850 [bacterium]|nr:hypothetical protein [bacterium]
MKEKHRTNRREHLVRILRRSRILEEKPYKGTMIHKNKTKYNRKKEKIEIRKQIDEYWEEDYE